MGFWSSVGSALSSGARAIGSAARAVSSAVSNGIRAVASAGTRLIQKSVSVAKQMASKVSDWKALLVATYEGAKKGAILGAKKGPLGAFFGGLIGAGWYGYQEYSRQSAEHDRRKQEEAEFERSEFVDTDISSNHESMERLAKTVSQFLPALQRKFSSSAPVESFEEYLRIDVAMRFMRDFINTIENMSDDVAISQTDQRFIALIDKLALDKPMTETELQEFDDIVKGRFGKSLLLIGSERLFSLWTTEQENCKQQVSIERRNITRAELRFKELDGRVKYNIALSDAEKVEHQRLTAELSQIKQSYEQSKTYLSTIRLMTGSAEGLLQQAETDNQGKVIRDSERMRNDRAGAILVNMERELESDATLESALSTEDRAFLEQYVDMHSPAAIRRQKNMNLEYSQNKEVVI